MPETERRRPTKTIHLGNLLLGSQYPVRVQSMTNTSTENAEETICQINNLVQHGCEIVRVAVPDEKALASLPAITSSVSVPVIADIHFRCDLAIKALKTGIKGLRINPGNIGSTDKYIALLRELASFPDIALRIGVNAGSLEQSLMKQVVAGELRWEQAMVDSALRYAKIAEEEGFENMKISLKASRVMQTVRAYRLLSSQCDYPLHLGITEAGTPLRGAVKSSIGIGMLLSEGIGDTFRVSLTGDPVLEVKTAYEILRALEIRKRGPDLISCPTCGRTQIDIISLVEKVDEYISTIPRHIKVAVMGCVVNGPGEAREADIGISGGKDSGVIFKKGQVIRKVPYERLFQAFQEELKRLLEESEDE